MSDDIFGILWDSQNFWESKCFRNIHKCFFASLSPKVLKDISFLFPDGQLMGGKIISHQDIS